MRSAENLTQSSQLLCCIICTVCFSVIFALYNIVEINCFTPNFLVTGHQPTAELAQQPAAVDLEPEQSAAGHQQLEAAAAVKREVELIREIDMELYDMRDSIKNIKGEIVMELEELEQHANDYSGQVQEKFSKPQQSMRNSSTEYDNSGK